MTDCVISSTRGFNENSWDAASWRFDFVGDDNVGTNDADVSDCFLVFTLL